ncbi:hypothetical protein DCS_08236 [Drechmeria coniospora]|uniref:Uncharacterized protein n=1 Tax=Drechmeria coniospora TaxID=98403 RepID=A0A151GGS2_DRECN|nr:hypothetical protein DCS_08236 [Drechmeria coniospora]KYK56266.1 hypothetical protein DCS_08236 [Drechmeria coniospora]
MTPRSMVRPGHDDAMHHLPWRKDGRTVRRARGGKDDDAAHDMPRTSSFCGQLACNATAPSLGGQQGRVHVEDGRLARR